MARCQIWFNATGSFCSTEPYTYYYIAADPTPVDFDYALNAGGPTIFTVNLLWMTMHLN